MLFRSIITTTIASIITTATNSAIILIGGEKTFFYRYLDYNIQRTIRITTSIVARGGGWCIPHDVVRF